MHAKKIALANACLAMLVRELGLNIIQLPCWWPARQFWDVYRWGISTIALSCCCSPAAGF